MNDPKPPSGGDISMEQLYSQSPIDVPLDKIYAIPGMPYFKESAGAFRPFFESVLKEGIREPVNLIPRREGGYYLAQGYRRCHAAVAAHLRTVPAIIENKTLQQVREEAATANIRRADTTGLHRITPGCQPVVPDPKKRPKRIVTLIKEMFHIEKSPRHER